MAFLIGVWLAITGVSLVGLVALLVDEGHLRIGMPRIGAAAFKPARALRASAGR